MYSIVIKVEGMEKRKRSAALMHVVLGFFLIAKAADYVHQTNNDFTTVLPFLAIALLSVFYGLFRKRIDPDGNYNHWIRVTELMAFVVIGSLLISTSDNSFDYISSFVMAAIALMLLFSEKRIYKDHELQITEEGVVIPGDYKLHTVPWNVLSDVVVRHDFVTVFHNDEKYLQYQVLQSLSELEVAKMNGFCREKIKSSMVNRES
jgi:hypothetical protein